MINTRHARNGADKSFVNASHGPKRARTPGTDLVRVRRLDDAGNPVDWVRATAIARARFGAGVEPYVADARWFAFEVRR